MAILDGPDEYFNRSYQTVAGTPREHVPVVYAVFCRQAGVLCGVTDTLAAIDAHCGGPVTVHSLADGDRFEARQVVMTIEGPFGQLVPLETIYLGHLALSGGATNMAALVQAAEHIPAIDMSARHYPPELAAPIAVAAAVGGAAGTSTRVGHAAVHERFGVGDDRIRIGPRLSTPFRLYGTIPHALNAVYGGSSIESAAAYLERCPEVDLTVLLDFEGRERDICAEAVKRFGPDLKAVRIDTPGNRVHQGGHASTERALEMRVLSQAADRTAAQAALGRYGFGPGVTIEAVYSIRDLLDSLGARHTRIVVSSGFDVAKVRAFRACNAPMDAIGTGSWVDFALFTSDIIRVYEDGRWIPRCKAGRREELIESDDLPIALQKG